MQGRRFVAFLPPYRSCITLAHNDESFDDHFHSHLASSALFIIFKSRMPSPPFTRGWHTLAHLIKHGLWDSMFEPLQKNWHWIVSSFFRMAFGSRNMDKKKWGRLVITALRRVNLPPFKPLLDPFYQWEPIRLEEPMVDQGLAEMLRREAQ
ncbi:hypothetical protein QJS10_CPB12g00784 [Acorus calamus]|uniref:Uncharacterized protein n=1 Tax=Acorus calamus TaxID=4465 RepID=A0AAV9DPS0_ACOCL|nr:hypothetical protein QJS10_CPB12g00784 [Acorus calamus]